MVEDDTKASMVGWAGTLCTEDAEKDLGKEQEAVVVRIFFKGAM